MRIAQCAKMRQDFSFLQLRLALLSDNKTLLEREIESFFPPKLDRFYAAYPNKPEPNAQAILLGTNTHFDIGFTNTWKKVTAYDIGIFLRINTISIEVVRLEDTALDTEIRLTNLADSELQTILHKLHMDITITQGDHITSQWDIERHTPSILEKYRITIPGVQSFTDVVLNHIQVFILGSRIFFTVHDIKAIIIVVCLSNMNHTVRTTSITPWEWTNYCPITEDPVESYLISFYHSAMRNVVVPVSTSIIDQQLIWSNVRQPFYRIIVPLFANRQGTRIKINRDVLLFWDKQNFRVWAKLVILILNYVLVIGLTCQILVICYYLRLKELINIVNVVRDSNQYVLQSTSTAV